MGVGGYTPAVTAEHKKKKATKVMSIGTLRLYECPLTYPTDDTYELMSMVFRIESTGVLFFAGGWADQPPWVVESFDIMKQETNIYLDSLDTNK